MDTNYLCSFSPLALHDKITDVMCAMDSQLTSFFKIDFITGFTGSA